MSPRAIPIVLMLLTTRVAEGSPTFLGFEFGGAYSSFHLVSSPRPGEKVEPRVLPSLGVSLTRPLGTKWSVGPSFRYSQQGQRGSWSDEGSISGTEKTLEHTLRGGLDVRYLLPRSLFLTASPEISYLASATITESFQVVNQSPARFEHGYASASDRWNAVLRVGAGTGWNVAGGVAIVTLRYTRAINPMTRITRPTLSSTERNIAWTGIPVPDRVTEWRLEGVELATGFSW